MRTMLAISIGLIAIGVYVLLRHPNAMILGVALIMLPGVVLVQACLVALAKMVRPPTLHPPNPAAQEHRISELGELLDAYHSFHAFLARVVGFGAIIYGIAALNLYYVVLGVIVVILFWILDRMIPTNQATHENTTLEKTDIAIANSIEPDAAQWGQEVPAHFSDQLK